MVCYLPSLVKFSETSAPRPYLKISIANILTVSSGFFLKSDMGTVGKPMIVYPSLKSSSILTLPL